MKTKNLIIQIAVAFFFCLFLASCSNETDHVSVDDTETTELVANFTSTTENADDATYLILDASTSTGVETYKWEILIDDVIVHTSESSSDLQRYEYKCTHDGEYTVNLIAENGRRMEASQESLEIVTLPIVNFEYEFNAPNFNCKPPVYITFDSNYKYGTSTWNFGDGTSKEGEQVSHLFTEAGEHIVRLAAQNKDGITVIKEYTIQVNNYGPFLCNFNDEQFEGDMVCENPSDIFTCFELLSHPFNLKADLQFFNSDGRVSINFRIDEYGILDMQPRISNDTLYLQGTGRTFLDEDCIVYFDGFLEINQDEEILTGSFNMIGENDNESTGEDICHIELRR